MYRFNKLPHNFTFTPLSLDKVCVNMLWRVEFESSYKTFSLLSAKENSYFRPFSSWTTAFLSERKQFLQMTLRTDKATRSYTLSGYHRHTHFLNPFFFTGAMSSPSYSWRKTAIKHTQNSATQSKDLLCLKIWKIFLSHIVAAQAKIITHYPFWGISHLAQLSNNIFPTLHFGTQ